MLILGRKEGEAIMIGEDVRLVILSADRKNVRIGIEAPPDVRIAREELVIQIANENRRASASAEWARLLAPVSAEGTA